MERRMSQKQHVYSVFCKYSFANIFIDIYVGIDSVKHLCLNVMSCLKAAME